MKALILAGLVVLGLIPSGMSQTNILARASRLEAVGRFQDATTLLRDSLGKGKITPAERGKMEFAIDRLQRIREDYSLTRDAMFNRLKEAVKGMTPEEFDAWVGQGWFDARDIDGVLRFFDSGVSNLFFRHPELKPRRLKREDEAGHERAVLEVVRAITQAAKAEKTPYVLPKNFAVTMSVTAAANAAPAGEILRAWIPIPRRYPFQDAFRLVSSTPTPKSVGDESSRIRSVYFEEPAVAGQPTAFKIDYEYTARGVHFDLDPQKVQDAKADGPELAEFVREAPHVVFTPEIKELSAKIIGRESNPLLKAKKIYDWMADHLQYSYATEYSTIPNISDYCRGKGYGDCGQQALLFITLCRFNGVPARWQTGWNLFPKHTTNHDWAEIYLPTYGWVPVDPYMGNFAMRYANTLTAREKAEVRDFYFGGLDQYRMAANGDHNQPLDPPKQSFRSDDVDFQRGELEHNGTNIYFDRFSYKLTYRELPEPKRPE